MIGGKIFCGPHTAAIVFFVLHKQMSVINLCKVYCIFEIIG